MRFQNSLVHHGHRRQLLPSASAFFFVALASLAVPGISAAQELNFDEPAVEQKKDSMIPQQLGPVSNITIGGAIDWRLTYRNGEKRPFAFVHVNELVVSANVGEHIAVSAEQLLLTSEVGTVVGQDHGFVTVTLVQLPFLPTGMTVKVGRFRGKFGLDAQVDSPANVFPSQELRSNGFVTDIGINVDYAFGDFEWIVEAFNGPDYLTQDGQKNAFMVDQPPIQTRFVWQPSPDFKLGFSGLYGRTWNNQIDPAVLDMGLLGSTLDTSRTIERRRVALDGSFKTGFAEFYGEGIYGRDRGRLAQPPDKSFTVAKGALGRVDVPLFRFNPQTRTKVALQYDAWEDASYSGRVGFISSAFSVFNDDGWTVRLGGSVSDVVFKSHKPKNLHPTPWNITNQLLVTF